MFVPVHILQARAGPDSRGWPGCSYPTQHFPLHLGAEPCSLPGMSSSWRPELLASKTKKKFLLLIQIDVDRDANNSKPNAPLPIIYWYDLFHSMNFFFFFYHCSSTLTTPLQRQLIFEGKWSHCSIWQLEYSNTLESPSGSAVAPVLVTFRH